jgi:hypothetical protein
VFYDLLIGSARELLVATSSIHKSNIKYGNVSRYSRENSLTAVLSGCEVGGVQHL